MDKEKLTSTIPYVVYEGTQVRNEKRTRLLIITIIMMAVLLFASNALWLYEWSKYDYESYEITADTGDANYIGNNGDIYNGDR